MSYIELRGVTKRYLTKSGPVVALQGLDVSVSRSEFVVLLGPSGCGKSTCLRLVAGLEGPTSGLVLLGGRPVSGCDGTRTLIFQRPSLYPWLTAVENVAFGLRMQGRPRQECAEVASQALEQMHLAEAADRYPRQLSGGMQQRVALARALVLDPAVVLMDEPLGAVDALLRSRLQRQIYQDCLERTVLFVTHSIREALVLADRIVVLSPQPGRVQREVVPPGRPPRILDAELLALEGEIEAELMQEGEPAPLHQT